jgi:DNA-binding MarR family transcriptional regulator
LLEEEPGITIPDLARKMGIKQNYLYRILPGLEAEFRVLKRDRGWYAIATPARPVEIPPERVLAALDAEQRLSVEELAGRLDEAPRNVLMALRALRREGKIVEVDGRYRLRPAGEDVYRYAVHFTSVTVLTRVFEVRAGSESEAKELLDEWAEEDAGDLPAEVLLVDERSEHDSSEDQTLEELDS